MAQLIPENVARKLDSLGRITLPKGLRNRMSLVEDSELELFTAVIDGRQCICLAKPESEQEGIEAAIEMLKAHGYSVEEV